MRVCLFAGDFADSSSSCGSSGVVSITRTGLVAAGGDAAERAGGGIDWRLADLGVLGDEVRLVGEPILACDMDCGRPYEAE